MQYPIIIPIILTEGYFSAYRLRLLDSTFSLSNEKGVAHLLHVHSISHNNGPPQVWLATGIIGEGNTVPIPGVPVATVPGEGTPTSLRGLRKKSSAEWKSQLMSERRSSQSSLGSNGSGDSDSSRRVLKRETGAMQGFLPPLKKKISQLLMNDWIYSSSDPAFSGPVIITVMVGGKSHSMAYWLTLGYGSVRIFLSTSSYDLTPKSLISLKKYHHYYCDDESDPSGLQCHLKADDSHLILTFDSKEKRNSWLRLLTDTQKGIKRLHSVTTFKTSKGRTDVTVWVHIAFADQTLAPSLDKFVSIQASGLERWRSIVVPGSAGRYQYGNSSFLVMLDTTVVILNLNASLPNIPFHLTLAHVALPLVPAKNGIPEPEEGDEEWEDVKLNSAEQGVVDVEFGLPISKEDEAGGGNSSDNGASGISVHIQRLNLQNNDIFGNVTKNHLFY